MSTIVFLGLLLVGMIASCTYHGSADTPGYYIDNGMLCHVEGDPNSQIGTAVSCEALP